mgnify:CR=1 FL=1
MPHHGRAAAKQAEQRQSRAWRRGQVAGKLPPCCPASHSRQANVLAADARQAGGRAGRQACLPAKGMRLQFWYCRTVRVATSPVQQGEGEEQTLRWARCKKQTKAALPRGHAERLPRQLGRHLAPTTASQHHAALARRPSRRLLHRPLCKPAFLAHSSALRPVRRRLVTGGECNARLPAEMPSAARAMMRSRVASSGASLGRWLR